MAAADSGLSNLRLHQRIHTLELRLGQPSQATPRLALYSVALTGKPRSLTATGQAGVRTCEVQRRSAARILLLAAEPPSAELPPRGCGTASSASASSTQWSSSRGIPSGRGGDQERETQQPSREHRSPVIGLHIMAVVAKGGKRAPRNEAVM